MTAQSDVLVIGAGVVGLATALGLVRRGLRPVVLEQFEVGTLYGSSHGRARIFRLLHQDEADVRDALAAEELWLGLERESGRRIRSNVGGLDLRIQQADRFLAAMQAAGAPVEVLDGRDVQRIYPTLRPPGGALRDPAASVLYADQVLAALRERAEAEGAEVREGARMERLDGADGHVAARLASGEVLEAGAAVLAGGPWLRRLAAEQGIVIPAEPTLQSVSYHRLADGPTPTVIEDIEAGEVYALVEPDGLLKVGLHEPGPPADLDGGDRRPREPALATLAQWVADRFVTVDGPAREPQGCIYTWLPGAAFQMVARDRVVAVSACSGRGFKFGVLTGDRVAAEAAARV
ncbi:NAD(P)/FAD-dependent oxidoreductase [Solirubrobacter soli]|uniref:NAD(P)/FAD-dependent oxidoreductase n=1 Tax=Solirubrobacter soli TaxID=363832 RepID=UPI000403FC1F|nr:FAD-dependent oxidoreductase [Solirubrobacter soli]